MKQTWYYSNTKIPSINKPFEFIGKEDTSVNSIKMSLICKLDIHKYITVLYVKKHSNISGLMEEPYYNIFKHIIPGDKWRYISDNELMAFL